MHSKIMNTVMAATCCVAVWGVSSDAQAEDARARNGRRCRTPDCRRGSPVRPRPFVRFGRHRAKNVIVFIGDGMGVSTITATRVYSVGLDGELAVDKFPYTALSKTYTSDHYTPDSAGTMTAMMTGVNTNSGVIGYGPKTERRDFNEDGDTERLWTLLELAKQKGMRTGVVSTARITHATPAATYAHVNERGLENDIALQALPTDPSYNKRLGSGIDLMFGGGRRFFLPKEVEDEEGRSGRRSDGRDLRKEYQDAGYSYVWNTSGFDQIEKKDLPVLGLFESSHMEYEYDRPSDEGGEPSLQEMTLKAINLLDGRRGRWGYQDYHRSPGYFLMVESGRIDHAHHAGNAHRALTDTEEFDQAIEAAVRRANLRDTLIIVTADHSHVFTMAGYPVRPPSELPYQVKNSPEGFSSDRTNILDTVYSINASTGEISEGGDKNGTPYTILGYHNGPGFRGNETRVSPREDDHEGYGGNTVAGPTDPNYRQESAVPLSSETHSGEEVALYAVGPNASRVRGTVKNTKVYEVVAEALGLRRPRR